MHHFSISKLPLFLILLIAFLLLCLTNTATVLADSSITSKIDKMKNAVSTNITAVKQQTSAMMDQDGDGISDGLQIRMATMAKDDAVDVIVTFLGSKRGGSRTATIRQAKSHAAIAQQMVGPFTLQHEFTIIHGFKATMTVEQAETLSRSPGIFRIEESSIFTTQISGASSDFGAVAARNNFTVDGSGVGICIVDTGIDASHEQFAGRNVSFHDVINGITTPYDDNGHGTHVAGIALGGGGTGNNFNTIGVAPNVSIFAAKVLDAGGSGPSIGVIEGIEYCANQEGVDIISMSLGSDTPSDGQDSMSMTINCISDPDYSLTCNATPTGPKIVIVAAGNAGSMPGTIGSPAAAEKAITVGAAANWSEDGNGVYLAAFSSRGPTLDGRIKPDITAPGVRILSAEANNQFGYVTFNGTSMATPFVSGAVALMLQQNPALMDATVPVDMVRNLLISSAQDRGALDSNDQSLIPDNEYGFGLIDVNSVVAQAGDFSFIPTALPKYLRFTGHVSNGDSQTFGPFTITEDQIAAGIPISATLTIEGESINSNWNPDLDLFILNDSGLVGGGSGDIVASECPTPSGECGTVSRQETVHYMPQSPTEAGDYSIKVTSFSGSGDFLLEVSSGPLMVANPPVNNTPPLANFIKTFCTFFKCGFEDASTDIDGSIVSWQWNFGDGSTSSEQHPVHKYSVFGDYTVTLTVTDDQGSSDTISKAVSVSGPRLIPLF